jgi:hypothetical protein
VAKTNTKKKSPAVKANPKPQAKAKAKTSAAAPRTSTFKDELKTLRDEAKVRLHLAGTEVRDAWDALSSQAEQVAHKLERAVKDVEKQPATEQARLKLHLTAMELRDQWEAVQPQLRAFSSALAQKGEEAAAALRALPTEQQKLQAKLAEMNAEAAISARLERAKHEIAKAKSASERLVRDAGKTFKDALKSIKKSFA